MLNVSFKNSDGKWIVSFCTCMYVSVCVYVMASKAPKKCNKQQQCLWLLFSYKNLLFFSVYMTNSIETAQNAFETFWYVSCSCLFVIQLKTENHMSSGTKYPFHGKCPWNDPQFEYIHTHKTPNIGRVKKRRDKGCLCRGNSTFMCVWWYCHGFRSVYTSVVHCRCTF